MHITKKQKGIILMCTSALLFASMQICIKMVGGTIPLMQQICARNLISLLLCFYIIRKHKLSMFGPRRYQPLLFVRSTFGLLGLVSLFYAASHANQADVTIISKLSPFLITLWAFLFLKERISKIQIPALIIAFAGALFIVNPVFTSNVFPLFIAFLTAFFSSVSYTLLAYFNNRVGGITIIMHFSTFCVLATLPFMLYNFVMPNMQEAILLLLIGLLGGLGQIALTYSYRMAPASEISIYNYSGIVFSAVLALLFLGEALSWHTILGGGLVIFASLLTYRYSHADEV